MTTRTSEPVEPDNLFSHCDECDAEDDAGGSEHCGECGNCWDHCLETRFCDPNKGR